MRETKRTTNTGFRCTPEEKTEITEAARTVGVSLTDWLLWASDHLSQSNPSRRDFLQWQLERENRQSRLDPTRIKPPDKSTARAFRSRLEDVALDYPLRENGYSGTITPEIREKCLDDLKSLDRLDLLDKTLESLTQPPRDPQTGHPPENFSDRPR